MRVSWGMVVAKLMLWVGAEASWPGVRNIARMYTVPAEPPFAVWHSRKSGASRTGN